METSRSKASKPLAWVGFGLVVVCALAALAWKGLPEQGSSPLELGNAAYDKGDLAQAGDHARAILKTDRDNPEALKLLARVTARLGRDGSAASLYQRLDPKTFEAEDLYLEGTRIGRAGKTLEALEKLEAARKLDPKHAETLESLSRVYTREHRLDDALKAAEELKQLPGYELSGGLMAGVLLVQMNDHEGAIAPLQAALLGSGKSDALKKAASDPSLFQKVLARSWLRTGKPAEAETLLRDILKAKGTDEETEWLLSRALLQQGKINEAAEARERSGTYGPNHRADPEPSLYVGERACAPCHSKIFEDSSHNRHTQSYIHGKDLLNLPMPDKPLADPSDPSVTHLYKKVGDRIEVETKVGNQLYKAVVDYAFGTPDRYVTMTKRDDTGAYRACRFSYFHGEHGSGWDLSAGDAVNSEQWDKFQGKPVASQAGVMRCLYCHTTNTRSGTNRIGPETADRAVGCERCHGPGGNHVAAIAAAFPDLAIANVKKESAEEVTKLCADCHNLNPPEVMISTPRTDPGWVRSPGITLTWSRCYTESAGGFTCLTCHDAHQSAKSSVEASLKACLSCHSGGTKEQPKTPCPVNPTGDCLTCHMPPVPNKALHLSLTDHYIRVRETSASPPGDRK